MVTHLNFGPLWVTFDRDSRQKIWDINSKYGYDAWCIMLMLQDAQKETTMHNEYYAKNAKSGQRGCDLGLVTYFYSVSQKSSLPKTFCDIFT